MASTRRTSSTPIPARGGNRLSQAVPVIATLILKTLACQAARILAVLGTIRLETTVSIFVMLGREARHHAEILQGRPVARLPIRRHNLAQQPSDGDRKSVG